MQVALRSTQREASDAAAERAAMAKEREEAKQRVVQLQEALQRASVAAASAAKGHATSEVCQARELLP